MTEKQFHIGDVVRFQYGTRLQAQHQARRQRPHKRKFTPSMRSSSGSQSSQAMDGGWNPEQAAPSADQAGDQRCPPETK